RSPREAGPPSAAMPMTARSRRAASRTIEGQRAALSAAPVPLARHEPENPALALPHGPVHAMQFQELAGPFDRFGFAVELIERVAGHHFLALGIGPVERQLAAPHPAQAGIGDHSAFDHLVAGL